MPDSQKVFVVGGGGMVGSAAAYAMAIQNIVEEIILIDINADLVWGQATDINDAMGLDSNVIVRTGDYSEIRDNDIVVITGGAAQQPGQTRLELLGVNAKIITDIVTQVVAGGAKPFIVMVTNPVDVLTYHALKVSGLPKNHVFGTGTTLDTSRLRSAIADGLEVDSSEVDVYVLGEHGDSSFSTIEGATVGDVPLAAYPGYTPQLVEGIDQTIRDRAYKIIQTKKSTYYAIGKVIATIVASLRQNSGVVLPVTSLAEGEYGLDGVAVGLPSIVSSHGVAILDGYKLTDNERASLQRSAEVVKQAIASLNE